MAFTTRRQFVHATAFAAAALCTNPAQALEAVLDADQAPPEAASIRKFASAINGQVIASGAPEYESSRLVFNRAFDRRPAIIVRCAAPSDVMRALEFARNHHLPVAVRGGGHSRAGFGTCDAGLVIDFSTMKRVQVDAGKRSGRAQAGALVRDFDQAMRPFGLATTLGGCPTVGIAGLTLGGGEGILMSKHGAACDNLLSATVVTVDGKELEVNRQSNPDLFWAIRGGGGNFAIATSFEFQLHPVGEVLSGALAYSAPHISDMLHAFARFALAAPDELNIFGEILPSAQGNRFLVHGCYDGKPGLGNDLLHPLRAPVRPQDDTFRAMPYPEAQAAGFVPAPFAHFQTNLFLPRLDHAEIEKMKTAIENAPPQFRILIIPFYGAVVRVAIGDTAFALRQPGFEVDMLGSWGNPNEKDAAVRWVKALRDALRPHAHGTYVNQLGETSEDLARMAYGTNYARLAEIKKKYDPANVLRINLNIKPA